MTKPAKQAQLPFYIGDILVSSDSVTTPEGTFPIAGCDFSAADHTVTVMKTTTAGQILCVLTIWIFLLGLLFLLDKKPHTTGAVVVTVKSPYIYHGTTIPIRSQAGAVTVMQDVETANGVAWMAGLRPA